MKLSDDERETLRELSRSIGLYRPDMERLAKSGLIEVKDGRYGVSVRLTDKGKEALNVTS